MKTTQIDLLELLSDTNLDERLSVDFMANKLIESGLVEIEEEPKRSRMKVNMKKKLTDKDIDSRIKYLKTTKEWKTLNSLEKLCIIALVVRGF